jgi:hypothetical protein
MRYSSNLIFALALGTAVSAHEIFTYKSGRFLQSEALSPVFTQDLATEV